jgi:hypothetical protein
MPSKIHKLPKVFNNDGLFIEYEKDSDCSEDEEIDKLHKSIAGHLEPDFYEIEKNKLNLAIIKKDIKLVKEYIDNGILPDSKTLYYAINTENLDIIDLIMEQDIPIVTGVLAEAMRTVYNLDVLDKLIKYLRDKKKLNVKKRRMYDEDSVEDHIIQQARILMNKVYVKHPDREKIIFPLLFRNCLETEVEELKNKLKKLKIKTINGKDINDISSQDELCELIKNQFNIQIDKYDDFNLEIIKPAIINTKNDNDDDDDDELN